MDTPKSATKVAKILIDVIAAHVKTHTNEILKAIAKDYELNIEELVTKYASIPPNIDIGRHKKKSVATNEGPVVEPKKRGRKKKPKEELIETEEYEYNGLTYLVDSDNNVYTYNIEQPVLVGSKLIDGRIKFLQVI